MIIGIFANQSFYYRRHIKTAILTLLIITFSSCTNSEYTDSENNFNEDREALQFFAGTIASQLEIMRFNSSDGKYPVLSQEEFKENIFKPCTSMQIGRPGIIKEVKYKSDGEHFDVYMVTKHQASPGKLFTVLKISDGKLYWKDNYAFRNESIDNVDWKSVRYPMAEFSCDDNGKPIITRSNKLPELVD